jgi:hypothetical protein
MGTKSDANRAHEALFASDQDLGGLDKYDDRAARGQTEPFCRPGPRALLADELVDVVAEVAAFGVSAAGQVPSLPVRLSGPPLTAPVSPFAKFVWGGLSP